MIILFWQIVTSKFKSAKDRCLFKTSKYSGICSYWSANSIAIALSQLPLFLTVASSFTMVQVRFILPPPGSGPFVAVPASLNPSSDPKIRITFQQEVDI